MNHPAFTKLRREIDLAITFHDLPRARALADEGLSLAGEMECLGEVMYFRAQKEIIAERFVQAIEYLDQAIAYNPLDGAAYNDLALCFIERGELEDALALFDKGIEVEPDYATIHHNKGWFLNQIGRHQESLHCFSMALALEPGRCVTYENMANAYENMGLLDEAMRAYQQALGCLPISQTVRDQIQGEIARLHKGQR